MQIATVKVTPAKPASENEAELATAVALRVQKGDKFAEIELVERYSNGLLSFLRRKTSDHDLADDLHQDTFRIVLERLRAGGLANPAQLAGFIHATAKNLVIAHFRKQARRKTDADCTVIDSVSHAGMTQSEQIMRDEQADIVRALLAELSCQRDRDLLRRYYLCEEDKRTICAALRISEKHFNRVIYRARERFKALLLKREKRDSVRVLH